MVHERTTRCSFLLSTFCSLIYFGNLGKRALPVRKPLRFLFGRQKIIRILAGADPNAPGPTSLPRRVPQLPSPVTELRFCHDARLVLGSAFVNAQLLKKDITEIVGLHFGATHFPVAFVVAKALQAL